MDVADAHFLSVLHVQSWKGGDHVSLAVGFSSSRMLNLLCELQDLADGRVSHSSPVSVRTGAFFMDEKSGVRMCKYVRR